MTRDDFDTIERELGVELPAPFVAALTDPPLLSDDDFLWHDPEWTVAENRRIRMDAPRPWPLHYLCIGDDGGGEYFFIDLALPASPVFRTRACQAHKVTHEAASIENYVLQYVHDLISDTETEELVVRDGVMAAAECYEPDLDADLPEPTGDPSWHAGAFAEEATSARRATMVFGAICLALVAWLVTRIVVGSSWWVIGLAIVLLLPMLGGVLGSLFDRSEAQGNLRRLTDEGAVTGIGDAP